jgi:hypothetical protein
MAYCEIREKSYDHPENCVREIKEKRRGAK